MTELGGQIYINVEETLAQKSAKYGLNPPS